MFRLWLFLLVHVVAWSCKSAFLVKYWVRYLATRLFKHLKTRIHFCIFLLEGKVNQLSTWKESFEVSFHNIIRAAWFCKRCNSLQQPSEIPPPLMQHQYIQIMAARVKYIPAQKLPAWGMIIYETNAVASYWPCCFFSTWSSQERFLSNSTPK